MNLCRCWATLRRFWQPKTAKGRERLAVWLKLLENGAARQASGTPMSDYDLSWMWEKLGVTELRR